MRHLPKSIDSKLLIWLAWDKYRHPFYFILFSSLVSLAFLQLHSASVTISVYLIYVSFVDSGVRCCDSWSINQSINQSFDQLISQSVNQPLDVLAFDVRISRKRWPHGITDAPYLHGHQLAISLHIQFFSKCITQNLILSSPCRG